MGHSLVAGVTACLLLSSAVGCSDKDEDPSCEGSSCSDAAIPGPCSGSCNPGQTCEIPPPAGSAMRNVGCVCTTSGVFICDTDVDFNQAEIPCGGLTCGANEYCAHVCDCCGVLGDGAVESDHDECRACDGAACPYMRLQSIPCA